VALQRSAGQLIRWLMMWRGLENVRSFGYRADTNSPLSRTFLIIHQMIAPPDLILITILLFATPKHLIFENVAIRYRSLIVNASRPLGA
jgi:hypothetical protein